MLSLVSLMPTSSAEKRSVLAVQSTTTLSRLFFCLNSRMSLRIWFIPSSSSPPWSSCRSDFGPPDLDPIYFRFGFDLDRNFVSIYNRIRSGRIVDPIPFGRIVIRTSTTKRGAAQRRVCYFSSLSGDVSSCEIGSFGFDVMYDSSGVQPAQSSTRHLLCAVRAPPSSPHFLIVRVVFLLLARTLPTAATKKKHHKNVPQTARKYQV